MNVKSFIQNDGSVTIMFDGGMPKVIPVENQMFGQITAALANRSRWSEVADMVDMATRIKTSTKGKFYVQDDMVYTDNEPMPETLSKRVLGFVEQNLPVDALVNFWNNLKRNPSDRSRGHLFAFLDQNNIPLTADGCFVAYKRVNENWKDVHTGTFDNSIGAKVSMDRAKVNDDPDQTCSSGLHVAAFPYAKDFYANGHLVEVKVNPMDVVAVPNDYNGQKMRVCAYEVVRECEGPRTELLYTDDSSYQTTTDETADEDFVYCPECDSDDYEDGYCYDCGYRDEDWDAEVEVDDVEEDAGTASPAITPDDDLAPEAVAPDGRGRICIPAKFIRAIGAQEGDTVYANFSESVQNVILDSETIDTNTDRQYVVDEYDNVRLSEFAMGLAKLNGLTVMVKMTLNDQIVIE